MSKIIADRLVEAFSEKMHEMIRKDLWAYSKNESLSINDMIKEKYHGIRPAPGYPACPDLSIRTIFGKCLRSKRTPVLH